MHSKADNERDTPTVLPLGSTFGRGEARRLFNAGFTCWPNEHDCLVVLPAEFLAAVEEQRHSQGALPWGMAHAFVAFFFCRACACARFPVAPNWWIRLLVWDSFFEARRGGPERTHQTTNWEAEGLLTATCTDLYHLKMAPNLQTTKP